MKCLYFRSFLAFHSLVVEGDLCSLSNSHTPAVVADLCSLSAPLLLPGQAGLVLVSIISDHTLGRIYARFSHR